MNRRSFTVHCLSAGAVAAAGVKVAQASTSASDEFARYDAVGLAELVRKKQVSPMELLSAAIARVEKINPALNAVVVKDYEVARTAIGAGLPDGPLRGVPFMLKDLNVGLAGTVTTNGGRLFTQTAPRDSEIVARYRRAGLVMFGKAAAPESGTAGSTESTLHGLTRNPWNPSRSAGGSSGGSCVVVASGMLPACHASDGGGSIRAPASQCGVFGLKPSRGLTPGSSAFGVSHAVTRTVRDSAALLDATAGSEAGNMFVAPPIAGSYLQTLKAPLRRLKIGMFTGYEGFNTHAECVTATRNAAALCEKLGHRVEEIKPPVDMAGLRDPFLSMFQVVSAAMLQFLAQKLGRPVRADEVEVGKWIAAEAGRKIDGATYLLADRSVSQITAQMAAFFGSYDVLLTPTLGQPPVDPAQLSPLTGPVDAVTKVVDAFGTLTVLGSLSGIPGMSVPLHWTADGLPVGSLFQAAFGNDALLLQLAAELEQAQPWASRYPPMA